MVSQVQSKVTQLVASTLSRLSSSSSEAGRRGACAADARGAAVHRDARAMDMTPYSQSIAQKRGTSPSRGEWADARATDTGRCSRQGKGQIAHHIPSATHPAPPFKVLRWLRTSGLAPCQEVGTVFAADGELNEYTIVQLGGPLLLLPLPPPWRFRIAYT